MIHLKSMTYNQPFGDQPAYFPFNLPVIESLERLDFTTPVTFLVGENGSGKSTLLEALACAIGSVTVGSESVKTDQTLGAVRKLAKQFKLAWRTKTNRGFFLRAEDFFGYAKRMAEIQAELQQGLRAVDEVYKDRPAAKGFARMPFTRELGDLKQRYGEGLDARSHGESFLALFQSRFVPGGLYLLDEPEAPLSPLRQLSFISLLKEMTQQEAQFIIASHSPIILAFPGATILSFDSSQIQPVAYNDLEHVTLTRSFLNNPEPYLKRL